MARIRRSRRLTDDESSFDIGRNEVKTAGPVMADERCDGPVGNLKDEIFTVKLIRDHIVDKAGDPKFLVEWLGFEKRKDWTWEPESNLRISGDQILNEYYATIGGRDKIFQKPGKIPRAKRTRRATTKKISLTSTKQWSPPPGSWEEHIERIDGCEEEDDGKLIVYLVWKNGQRTKHGTQIIYWKCPQKMLKYYEKHIKIVGKENDALQKVTIAF